MNKDFEPKRENLIRIKSKRLDVSRILLIKFKIKRMQEDKDNERNEHLNTYSDQ
jgi:hypothetical protein